MDIARFFYKVYLLSANGAPKSFLGTAFPVGPGGNLLTCKHVVDVQLADGDRLGVFDNELGTFKPLETAPILSDGSAVDLALLRNALGRPKEEFFPILTPPNLTIGEDVYTFGYFAIGGNVTSIEQGYFAGRITNFFAHQRSSQARLTLPFAIIEGLSGSPLLTYHNGPKVVGIATGNRSSRILASEILEYRDERTEYRETVNRIVEFGVGHHCAAITEFLSIIHGVGHVVSDGRVQVPNLE